MNIFQSSACALIAIAMISCNGPTNHLAKKSTLSSNEVRARVVEVDINTSMVKAVILACGKDLEKEWGAFLDLSKTL